MWMPPASTLPTAGRKRLSAAPGLAPITCSPRAVDWLRDRKSTPVSWYLDLKLLLDYYESAHRYHHTAPISMFYALREALAVVAEEGLACALNATAPTMKPSSRGWRRWA